MNPRRTATSNTVLRLPGGNEDNDLWAQRAITEQGPVTLSVWQPNTAEREQITNGANIELRVWGPTHPPVAINTTDAQPANLRPTLTTDHH